MTDNALGLRSIEAEQTQTLELSLPFSVWQRLRTAADGAGLALEQAVAQIIVDRCALHTERSAPRARRSSPKDAKRSSLRAA